MVYLGKSAQVAKTVSSLFCISDAFLYQMLFKGGGGLFHCLDIKKYLFMERDSWITWDGSLGVYLCVECRLHSSVFHSASLQKDIMGKPLLLTASFTSDSFQVALTACQETNQCSFSQRNLLDQYHQASPILTEHIAFLGSIRVIQEINYRKYFNEYAISASF